MALFLLGSSICLMVPRGAIHLWSGVNLSHAKKRRRKGRAGGWGIVVAAQRGVERGGTETCGDLKRGLV